jgi:arylsulfatase A-like enzyme
VFSDHGDFTGDYGLVEKTQNTFQDCLSRVPFIVKPPAAMAAAPGIRNQLIELIDFPATVYDCAGIEPPYWHFGKSLRSVLADTEAIHRDAVFCEGGRLRQEVHASERESTSGMGGLGLYSPRIEQQLREGDVFPHSKATMCRDGQFKYVRRAYETDEFYDLGSDPGETTNLINEPSSARSIDRLKERMLAWYMETCDVVPLASDQRNFLR